MQFTMIDQCLITIEIYTRDCVSRTVIRLNAMETSRKRREMSVLIGYNVQ